MKVKWKEGSLCFKIAAVASILVSVTVLVLAILQLFGVWRDAGYAYIPLMGINLLLQAYAQWKPNRGVAVFSLCAAVAVLICAVVVYVMR